jgi:thiamine biosynthesis lipoprotein
MITHRFRSMGCDIAVRGGTADERASIEDLFVVRDRAFSRFIADSELNRVNAAAGVPTIVSPLFADTLRIALAAAAQTDGLVDPTLGGALVNAGYTIDASDLMPNPAPPGPPQGTGTLFLAGRVVAAPRGVVLDLNGVVKSLAVDDAIGLLTGDGSVSAGGDLRTRGPVTVSLPADGVVELRRGALATSGTTTRRWLRGGELQHHLIDPRTGAPAVSPWREVTACGTTCVGADIAAKAGFLSGETGPEWLDARDIPGRFVRGEGGVVTNHAWDASMRGVLECT